MYPEVRIVTQLGWKILFAVQTVTGARLYRVFRNCGGGCILLLLLRSSLVNRTRWQVGGDGWDYWTRT